MKNIKVIGKLILILMLGTALLAGCSSAKQTTAEKKVRIGISQILQFNALDDNRRGFLKALQDNGYVGGKNLEVDYQNAQGDLATAQTIAKQFASQKKDLIFAIATPSAQAAYNSTKDIPILISAVTDPIAAGIVKSMEAPGTNVSGTSDYLPVDKQLELLKIFAPEAKRIGVIYNTSEINSEVQIKQLKEYSQKNGYEVVTVGITSTNEITQAMGSLAGKIDVLFVPTDNLVVSAMPLIAQKGIESKIPVIGSEAGTVTAGALATQGIDYYQLGYKTGEMAVKVLKGEDISKMPVVTASETKITVNEDTLNALGLKKPDNPNIEYVKTKQ
jgi:putative ABC transport system substrate-binding protein